MELTDAVRRVFVHHARLIVACLLVGSLAAWAWASERPAAYTASARLMLDARASGNADAVAAVADAARAIATSAGVAAVAVDDTDVARDPRRLIETHSIAVGALGASGFVVLDVTDPDPEVAAALANALAGEVVERWVPPEAGATEAGADALQRRIDDVGEEIADIERRITRLSVRIAAATTPEVASRLRAERDSLIAGRDGLVQERQALQGEMGRLVVANAGRFVPEVVDPAVAPTVPNATHAIPLAALGALLGFLVGAGLAAAIETFRPTLVGGDAIADALGAPVLGTLSVRRDEASDDGGRLPLRMRLAAARVGARTVELVPVSWPARAPRFHAVAEDLWGDGWGDASANGNGHASGGSEPTSATGDATANGDEHALVVRSFGDDGAVEAAGRSSARALVAVVPPAVKRTALRDLVALQELTEWPLIGVITVRGVRWPRIRRAAPRVPVPGGDETPSAGDAS
jgi:hypothetical protein